MLAAMNRLANDLQYRRSIDRRMRAAGRLVQAALIDLAGEDVPDLASEFVRRDLDLLCHAIASLVTDFRSQLATMAPGPGEAARLGLDDCPQCGWMRPALPTGHCPRCEQLREAYRERRAKPGGRQAHQAR
jgi:ssDNA-binding Zn-finger/Zn-ribbon topoisomerase 1